MTKLFEDVKEGLQEAIAYNEGKDTGAVVVIPKITINNILLDVNEVRAITNALSSYAYYLMHEDPTSNPDNPCDIGIEIGANILKDIAVRDSMIQWATEN